MVTSRMLKSAFAKTKKQLKKLIKNLVRLYKRKPRTVHSVLGVFLSLLVFFGLYLALRPRPNDDVYFVGSRGVAILENKNPSFLINFGKRTEPEKQWVRFEAKASTKNPFGREKGNFFTEVVNFLKPKKDYGIEMSLEGVKLSETEELGLGSNEEKVKTVAEIVGTDEVRTSTELIESGRVIGEYTKDPVSKKTVLNKSVADGVDIEYQVIKGLGLKEEIVIRNLEEYTKDCNGNLEECKLPLNEFIFDLKLDEGLELRKGWFTFNGKSTEGDYFTDKDGNYVAHFLPSWAMDSEGNRTYDVGFEVEKKDERSYRVKVIVDISWLFSPERIYPVRIDPSIVHDTKNKFDEGIFDGVISQEGPRIGIKDGLENCGRLPRGGTITYVGGYVYHTFYNSGKFLIQNDLEVDVLVVGGGGGAGIAGTNTIRNAGGGGGGGLIFMEGLNLESDTYGVTVGAGGLGATDQAYKGENGSDSTFGELLVAKGGGGGGSRDTLAGLNGGSGGGAARYDTTYAAGGTGIQPSQGGDSGTYGYGNNGATSASGGAGGGGGAGGAGGRPAGGVGLAVWGTTYAAGGAAESNNASGAANTGKGGNAAAASSANAGGNGGSGIVIVRYPIYNQACAYYGTYISSVLDLEEESNIESFSWIESGVNTIDGETPYSTTGLVAQWNFNESSGTTLTNVDGECGSNCDGTLTNFANTSGQDVAVKSGWTFNNRKWGEGALMFDGSNDYVTVADDSSLNPTDALTVEAWVNPSTFATGSTILMKSTSSSWNDGYGLAEYQGNNNIGFFVNNYSTNTVYGALNLHKWSYVVGTYDGTELKLYINGVLVDSLSYSTEISNSSSSLTIGMGSGGAGSSYLWNGYLDSTRVYSRALSESEILSNYQAGNIEFQYRMSEDGESWSSWGGGIEEAMENFDGPYLYNTDETGLISYWAMDETTGGSVTDLVGSNDGTATGTKIVNGKNARGREFNGSSDYISISDDSSLKPTDEITVEAWVFPTSNSVSYPTIVSHSNSSWQNGYGLMVHNYAGEFYFWITTSTGNAWPYIAVDSYGEWYHLVGTYDGSYARLYVNGILKDEIALTGTIVHSSNPLLIGKEGYSSGDDFWEGSIDEVRIYDVALDSDKILQNYLEGFNKGGLLYTDSEGKVKMDDSQYSQRIDVGSLKVDSTTVGYWKLEEESGSGAFLKDLSGNGFHGTIYGNADLANGYIGNGRNVYGTNSKIDIGDIEDFDVDSFTVEAFVKRNSGNCNTLNHCTIFSKGSNTFTGYNFSVWSGKLALRINDSQATQALGSTDIVSGRWYHVAGTYDSTTGSLKVYLDGVLDGESTNSGPISDSTRPAVIGNGNINLDMDFNGVIDEVMFSNTVKSATEIKENYKLSVDHTSDIRYGVNNKIQIKDLNGYTKVPFWIASDSLGSNIDMILGNSEYSNYQPDINTVGYWSLDDRSMEEVSASGGTVTTWGGYKIHTFTSGGTFSIDKRVDVKILVIAGGGGGGGSNGAGGGGGAGGLLESDTTINPGSYTVTVGTGGAGSQPTSGSGARGGSSSFGSLVSTTGGGGGGGYNGTNTIAPLTGGSGGGGGSSATGTFTGAAGTSGQGYAGGNGRASSTTTEQAGGGGGGRSQTGTASTTTTGGKGGNGLASTITGTSITYAGGGGGSKRSGGSAGAGGTGGGGAGGLGAAGGNGTDGLGGGGGGGSAGNKGGDGGDGIVIVRYANDLVETVKSGLGNNSYGTLVGTTHTEYGKLGGARSFNGTGDSIFVANDSSLNPSSITLEAWIKPSVYQTGNFINKGDNSGYRFRVNSTGTLSFLDRGSTNTLPSNSVVPLNEWSHVVATGNSTGLKIYINGKLDASNATAYGGPSTSNNLLFGEYFLTEYYAGLLDEVRISNVARTPSEIREAYEIGSRTHAVKVSFKADLQSSNLISGSGDTSFTISETTYGTTDEIENLNKLDNIVIREVVSGVEYMAQGEVATLDVDTGAVTVVQWDSGSTFPSGGYTIEASVFKWQREYLDIRGILPEHKDGASTLTFKLKSNSTAKYWIDSVKGSKDLTLEDAEYGFYDTTYFQTEWTSPSIVVSDDSNGGAATWQQGLGEDTALSSDDEYSTVTLSSGDYSEYLKATNFGFNILSRMNILGIEVGVEKYGTGTTADVVDYEVQIVKSDASIGTTNKALEDGWSTTDTDEYVVYGSSSDSWDEEWTPADVNNDNFGVAISCEYPTGNTGSGVCNIDHIRIKVYYYITEPRSFDQYFQYRAIFTTTDSSVTPWLSQVSVDYSPAFVGPTMDQIMRHGKWFSASGQKENFWWARSGEEL